MTLPSAVTRYSCEELEAMAKSLEFWWHSIDLGQGVITQGWKTPDVLVKELEALRLPDLSGKTVLDIGAYDGFFSFEAEKRGARRVVALDHYVWSLDLPKHIQYWRECKERGIVPLPNESTPYWQPDRLPGKRGYDVAHKALHSKVKTVVGDFMTMNLDSLGTFDVVLFLGVLYHMENPFASLRRLASVTNGVAIIETHAIAVPGYEHLELCEFYSSNQLNGDVSNWWGPNLKALEGMCRAAGFAHVEVVKGRDVVEPAEAKRSFWQKLYAAAGRVLGEFSSPTPLPPQQPQYFRAVLHAWK